MKKIILRALLIVLVLIIVAGLYFADRISGACTIYQMVSQVTDQIKHGNEDLNLKLSAAWTDKGKTDSLQAFVDFKNDQLFIADIQYGSNRYTIRSNENQTEVDVGKSGLKILGQGPEQINFDVLLLINDIIHNHPKLLPVLELGFLEKAGIALWSFYNCDFEESETYDIIRFPNDIIQAEVELSLENNTKNSRLVVKKDELVVKADLFIDTNLEQPDFSSLEIKKQLDVSRVELNTAIYRGALRTAGLLIERYIKLPVDTQEKTWGKGTLSFVDGNRVFMASGSNKEIGAAHGALLKEEIRRMIDATLYTVGWVYTIEKQTWFIDKMRSAYNRLEPFIPQRYQEEMIALAEASGFSLEEVRITNVFPALFHCSGFALFNEATENGQLLHGRILDYMTEIGLQDNAVVQIIDPEGYGAFANIGYAGFIGSVSGMNEHQVAFGEMGGRGEGDWDGMPMGFLMRDGLERATNLDEALTIFRDTPRTCEYFYVISDGKIPDARGLATTPEKFEVIKPNQWHPLLQNPQKDAVLMSAKDRYKKLAERVSSNHGKIDAQKAIRLMDRPVAMKSNLHSVLFAPQTLEFWVANAGVNTPACNEPYTHYSLKDLLTQFQ